MKSLREVMNNWPSLTKKGNGATQRPFAKGIVRCKAQMMALEARLMFDGAALAEATYVVADATSGTQEPSAQALFELAVPATLEATQSQLLTQAQIEAQQYITDFLQSEMVIDKLFSMFHAGHQTMSDEWLQAANDFLLAFNRGEVSLNVLLQSGLEMRGAMGAFAANSAEGEPAIYLNVDWIQSGVAAGDITKVLLEEFGHHIDAVINGLLDTPGDEGQMFAAVLLGEQTSYNGFAQDDDHATLQIGEDLVAVELANFNFINAYEVDTTFTAAGKESNTHDFNFNESLGQVNVTDTLDSRYFSGNDVSAISIVVNGETLYGWISRPIKDQGIVRGFYFWTDADFTSLQLAQADGNTDGDRNVADNRGFILVVDQNYFNSLSFKSGSTTIKNVGSSSDRVDSSMNSLISVNTAPALTNDTISILEDASSGNTGNVLDNDTDVNTSDVLRVSQFVINGVSYAIASPTPDNPTSNTALINGIGELTMSSDGSYTFVPAANYFGAVPTVTYTVNDGNGGVSSAFLSIIVTSVNDAPTATDDSITIAQGSTVFLNLNDFGVYQDVENSPLAKIMITTLPDHGTLEYFNGTTWVLVTLNQELAASVINAGRLRFSPTGTENGDAYTTIGFKVSDGSDYSEGAYALTVNVTSTPALPLANNDSGDTTVYVAKEAGYNEVGYSASGGNVLTNDTPASGITVTSVFNTSIITNTEIKGMYGTLVMSADGTFSYVADNANPLVDALNVNDTLSETFTYTITNANGDTSTATLTVKIAGTNDAPMASDDTNSLKELFVASNGNYGTVSGSVLTNDTDIDNTGLQVVIGSSDTIPSTPISVTEGASSPITSATYTIVQVAGSQWNSANGVPAGQANAVNVLIGGQTVLASDGVSTLKVWGEGNGAAFKLVANDPVTFYRYSLDTVYGVTGSTTTFKLSSITAQVASSTTITVTDGDATGVQVGYIVTGDGIPTGGEPVTVQTINGSSITLSTNVTVPSNTILTFTDPASIGPVAGTGEMLLLGNKGYLTLRQNGTYTYTLTDNTLNAGDSYVETFNYQAKDADGVTSSAILKIRIDGTSSEIIPVANDDQLTLNEDTVGSIANLLSNDTGTAVHSYTWGEYAGTLGVPLVIDGVGTLTITSAGALTFVPATNYAGSVPSVTYTISWETNNEKASATVSIIITPDNDAPTATDDVITIEKNTSVILSLSDFGTYSDIEGDALSHIQITNIGTQGTLEYLNAFSQWVAVVAGDEFTVAEISAGNLRYTPDNNEVGNNYNAIQFKVKDGADYSTASSILTINVLDVDVPSAPVNTIAAQNEIAEYQTLSFTGLSVADVDNDIASVTLNVANGSLSVNGIGALSTGTGSTSNPLVLTGTQAEINAMLATLVYTPVSGFTGEDTLRMVSVDSGGRTDTDFVDITVNADVRALTVTGTTVNEASPYLLFEIGGHAGQNVTLALATTGVGEGYATLGQDVSMSLEYYNGNTWESYTTGTVTIPGASGAASLMVRVAVYQDVAFEGLETLKLIASNSAGTSFEGLGGIRDDGTGEVFTATDLDRDPDTTPSLSALDDDRPLLVNNITVNEASPYAVFEVTGTAGQLVTLSLAQGSATENTDYGTVLEYYDVNQTGNGNGGWVAYTTDLAIEVPAGNKLLVRTTIINDNPAVFEGPETFALVATNQSNLSVVGTATIVDDGTGVKYDGTVTANTATTSTTGLDKDYILALVGEGPVNEGSTYAMFNVTASAGETLDLSLTATVNSDDRDATLTEFIIQFSYDGINWTTYSNTSKPTVPIGDASGEVYVRVNISNEQDDIYEGAETFVLNAAISGHIATTASVTTTIIDDGTGTKYDGTVISGTSNVDASVLDDDRNEPATFDGDDTASVTEDSGTYTVGGTLIVEDIDSSPAVVVQNGTLGNYGSFSIDANGVWTYTANNSLLQPLSTSAQATETFTITTAGGTTHNIVITLNGINDAPSSSDGSISTSFNTPKSVNLPVATDVDTGDAIIYAKASDPTYGTVTVNANGSYTYTPLNGFSGVDTFSYSVTDGHGGVNVYNITVTVAENAVVPPPNFIPETPPLNNGPLPNPVPFEPAPVLPSPNPFDGLISELGLKPSELEINRLPTALPWLQSELFNLPSQAQPNSTESNRLLTSNSERAFPIVVTKADEPILIYFYGIADQAVNPETGLVQFSVPTDAFAHSNPLASIRLHAQLANGQKLPDWLAFDSVTGTFVGEPPLGDFEDIEVKVIAIDEGGREAVAVFKIRLVRDGKVIEFIEPLGRSSLSEQVRQASQRASEIKRLVDPVRSVRSA
ncbi:MAG: Ig-like domain-containing protein [Methylotenera sp.]|uniref:Ig-like domain-containing protein n=1 Tax=Methylotenera sp. TaxID=2051956 RepID=UPI00271F073F|nr:Ig-like domain-containing protein [Methylotenera sp.]MDO9150231.1 Ig-like domain-containing protein [Methylotenera sp.]